MKNYKVCLSLALVCIVMISIASSAFAAPDPGKPASLGTNAKVFTYRNSIDTDTCWSSNGGAITVRFTGLKCSKGSGIIDVVMYKYNDGWEYVTTRSVPVGSTPASCSVSFPRVVAKTPLFFKMYGVGGAAISGSIIPH